MLRIGMSDCGEKNDNYERYLRHLPDLDIITLSRGNEVELEKCDGLVLTGGEDISPELYGDWADETVHVNSERDGVEYKLIDAALKKQIPILGICRGLQVLNVYFGGTLILDLEKYCKRVHTAISKTEDRYHNVKLIGDSSLKDFIQREDGTVNSSHHQAAERMGVGLRVIARAEDGTVEAIEGEENSSSSIDAVQWHPERIQFESPFASGVLNLFGFYIGNAAKRLPAHLYKDNERDNHNLENYAQWRLQDE